MAEKVFYKEIPFQSNDSEFNSFFGFKLGMTMGAALFKVACYGLNDPVIFQKGKKITIDFSGEGVTFCSCEIRRVSLTFVRRKDKYYLVCSEIIVEQDSKDGINKLLTNYLKLEQKYPLVVKGDHYFYKPEKTNIGLSESGESGIIVAKKHVKRVQIEGRFLSINKVISFIATESVEIRPFGWNFNRLLNNYSNVSDEDKEEFFSLLIGLICTRNYNSFNEIEDYALFWGDFCDFWAQSDYSVKFLELAHRIKRIFEESDPEKIEETKGLISKTITEMPNLIKAMEEEEKKAKKEEQKKRKEAEINKLTESLDDL